MKFNQKNIPTNDINISTIVEGDGEPIILVHGWPESWYSWRHQINPLVEAGYKIIVPDVRGYGNSDRPIKVSDYSMKKLTSDIIGILDFIEEEKAHIIGHDWGAPISWYTSLLHPNRILSVTGLSVPHSFLGNDVKPTDLLKEIYKDNFFYILYFQEEGRAEKELEKDLEFSLRTLFSNSDFYGLSQMIKFQSTLNKKKNEGFLDGMLEHNQLPKWLNQEDLTYYVNQFKNSGMRGPLNRYRCIDIDWEELRFLSDKKIEKPACFITGELDPVNFMILEGLRNLNSDKPDNELFSEHLNKNYSDLRVLEIIKECGHWTQQEKPKEVNKILLDFLKKI